LKTIYFSLVNILCSIRDSNLSITDLVKSDELYNYTQEQKDEMLQLLKELPTALEIVLSTQKFECGEYKMKIHEGLWFIKLPINS